MATSGIDQTHLINILNASLLQATFTASVTAIHLRLMTANGSSTANGTELTTGTGYTSGTGAPTISFSTTANYNSTVANAGAISNSAAVTLTNMQAATIPGIELWDGAGTPARKWWGALTASKTTNAGDTLSFAIGSVVPQIAA